MKYKVKLFINKNLKKICIVLSVMVCILAVSLCYLLFTYSKFTANDSVTVMENKVGSFSPDDVLLSFYLDDGNGNQSFVESMPTEKGHNYKVTVTCDNEATGSWDYDAWGPNIRNVTTSRTKCKLIFGELPSLVDTIRSITPVTTGEGLYEVTHSDAEITYTTDTTAINNLKQTEYRYAGANPNNYVTFNGETAGWRIIGLVNTPEGQRVKLVRASSIGNYSWDSSASGVNSGYGVNEWSQADLMTTLNSGAYYNRTNGTCYYDIDNKTKSCDFSSNGLTKDAKKMIDTVTWNTGSAESTSNSDWQTANLYNYERSNTGKICNGGTYCNDSVTRTIIWKGQVGLPYPSDYGYATSGGSTTNRNTCMSTDFIDWDNYSDCYGNDWLYNGLETWLLTPGAASIDGCFAFFIDDKGSSSYYFAVSWYDVIPTLYLTSSVKVVRGNGTSGNPYILGI